MTAEGPIGKLWGWQTSDRRSWRPFGQDPVLHRRETLGTVSLTADPNTTCVRTNIG